MWQKRHPKLSSNDQFYAFIDAIAEKLRSHGFTSDADRLHTLVHEMAWTTSTEVFGELRSVLKDIRSHRADFDPNLSADIQLAIKTINKALRR
jgi:hypothetical protein